MKRVVVVCPGRGSYSKETLGSLANRSAAASAWLDACDAWRASNGRPTVRELDAAAAFSGRLHVAGENASLLTFAGSVADFAELSDRFEVVGVCGNSMGWYTALAVAGALPPEDAVRLVDTMGVWQEGNVIGGQVMTPLTGPDWAADPARRAAIEAALAQVQAEGHVAEWSIDLGSFAVLGADAGGLKRLMEILPQEVRGERRFPAVLPLHSAFHTSLLAGTSARAQHELSDLRFQAPRVPLFDGRGAQFAPRWADPAALADYTLGHQVVRAYDFVAGVQAALAHTGAEGLVLLGPGNALGGPASAALLGAGWRGARRREDLARLAPLLSFGVPEQAAQLR